MTVEELINRSKPYEPLRSKDELIAIFQNYPELKDKLEKMLTLEDNQEWLKRGEKEGFFFHVSDDSWKHKRCSIQNYIKLDFVGPKNGVPTISVNIYQKPV